MKKIILSIALFVFALSAIFAQDSWVRVVSEGINSFGNRNFNSFELFNGQLYVASGSTSGHVYRTSTGNPNDWQEVFYRDSITSVNALATTAAGGGKIFAVTKGWSAAPAVYQSTDGVNWTTFYRNPSYNDVVHIFPFKGTGVEDSIYVVLDVWPSNVIMRAAYNTTDSTGYFGGWDTVLDFNVVASGTRITDIQEHNGKIFLATNLSTIWSSADGFNWSQNAAVGNGFGNPNTYSIRSLQSFGGFLYAGTENGTDGAQLYRTNDEVNWPMIYQFSDTLNTISGLFNEDGKLWAALKPDDFNYGVSIYKSVDGTAFSLSATNGFGDYENNGNDSYMKTFGNNIYWTGEYYFGGRAGAKVNRGGPMGGSEIYRLCTTTSPVLSLGPDQTVCQNVQVVLDAGVASNYAWSTGDTTQTVTIYTPGSYTASIVGVNGCSAIDTVVINHITAPSAYISSPYGSATICKDSSINISASANSNLFIPFAPIHKPTNNLITDYFYSYDTIPVSGIVDSAGTALYSVTIDSLEHTFVGDVELRLYAPNGSVVVLSYGHGGGTQNMVGAEFNMMSGSPVSSGAGPFTGTWLPDEPFNWLYGNANGNWRLEMYDHAGGDTGILKGWSIRFAAADTVMTYSWTPATGLSSTNTLNTVATPMQTTTYTISVTNTIGCTSTQSVIIDIPSIDIYVADDSICYGASTSLNVIGQNTLWFPYSTLSDSVGSFVTATPTATTTYFAYDTISGCAVSDSATVYYSPQLTASVNADQTICYTGSATLASTVVGGVAPYQYLWSDGGPFSGYNATETVSPLSDTDYMLYVFDAFYCLANIDTTSVFVTPSTDIIGNVTYSGGALSNGGTAVLYKYYPFFISFDTVQTASIDAAGNYLFTAAPYGDYIVKIFPNTTYPTTIPTYYSNTYLWDAATQIVHGCSQTDTANIVMVEQIPPVTGPGMLGGRIVEGDGFSRLEGDPIPGIDVKLGRNPGGALVTNTTTDVNGEYSFANLPLNDGGANGVSYTVYVDIPGLGRDSSYTVSIDATTPVLDSLNYLVDSTTVYIVPTSSTGISNPEIAKENKFSVYPNPFNGSATIAYTLLTDSEVRLEIYNVLGVKVATIANTAQQAGDFKYSLDEGMSSGVYFVSLTINNKTTTQRIVKIK